ncbi:MAG: sugar phosphate isomerase/epimerase [Thermoguttaceae bacterium]|nr:sugar phosphate isomerase/epimerase [Thermoguttaceae bacterium]MDW8077792.1 sugar phosphate isomerase/epimerase [Thermoguttaceae bacterium]
MRQNRRAILRTVSLWTGAVALGPGNIFGLVSGRKIPVGVQLYSVREDAKKDLPRVLAAVREAGYEGVEFAGYYGHSAGAIRKMLDNEGLTCCGSHVAWELLQPEQLEATVEFNQAIGNKYLICPYLAPQLLMPKEKAIDTAKRFNELAEKVAEKGMLVGYHAHAHDFKKVNGETAWEVFFSYTKPEVVMQMDVGNCLAGGGDPYAMIEMFPGRSKTIHLKEFGGPSGAVIGEGEVDWGKVFGLCETVGGTEWYIVEQESYRFPPLEAIRRCRENLKKMGR